VTPVIYLKSAVTDLTSIETHYSKISQQTSDNVYQDILAAIEVLQTFPDAGRLLEDGSRKFPSHKYRFNITYFHRRNIIEIIGIYRFQNR